MNKTNTAKNLVRIVKYQIFVDKGVTLKAPIGGESYTFVIAVFVIGSFVVFSGLILFYLHDLSALEKMTAGFGGFVAAILGYFFGQRPVQTISRQMQDAAVQREEFRKESIKAKNEAQTDAQMFEQLKEELESLKRQLGIDRI